MSINLSCLNVSEDVKIVLNKSVHISFVEVYKPNGNSYLKKFSSSITNSIYSMDDVELYLKTSLLNQWKIPTKIISSIIILSSLLIILFLTFSILFYIIEYSNLKRFQKSQENFRKKLFQSLLILLLIVGNIYLLIDMIFLLKNLIQIKENLNKSVEKINEEFNSKNLSNYFKDFLNKIEQFSTNVSIIDLFKSLFLKRISILLNDYYFIEQINLNLNQIHNSFHLIFKNKFYKNSFYEFTNSYKDFLKDLINLNKKICDFIIKNHFTIEQKILYLLNQINQQFQNLISIFNEKFLNQISFHLFNQNSKEELQSNLSTIINLTVIIILFLTIIPSTFIWIIFTHFYLKHFYRKQRFHFENKINSNVKQVYQSSFIKNRNDQRYPKHISRHNDNLSRKTGRSIKSEDINENAKEKRSYLRLFVNKFVNKLECDRSYRLFINPIRIGFAFLTILLIVLSVLIGLFYGFDLFLQSSCRLVHYKQENLISFLTDHLIKSTDEFDLNRQIKSVINDCNNNKHFSKTFLEEYSNELNDQLIGMISNLNENLYKQFVNSIQILNISSELNFLHNLIHLAGLNNIKNQINLIQENIHQIENTFTQIIQKNSQLSNQFINQTLNEIELLIENFVESTIDSCPLPMNNIRNLDQLICHQTADLINGLWLRLTLFAFFIVFALCIFPIYIYQIFTN